MIYDLAIEMNKRKIKPELEAFDAGMINYAKYLIKKKFYKNNKNTGLNLERCIVSLKEIFTLLAYAAKTLVYHLSWLVDN